MCYYSWRGEPLDDSQRLTMIRECAVLRMAKVIPKTRLFSGKSGVEERQIYAYCFLSGFLLQYNRKRRIFKGERT